MEKNSVGFLIPGKIGLDLPTEVFKFPRLILVDCTCFLWKFGSDFSIFAIMQASKSLDALLALYSASTVSTSLLTTTLTSALSIKPTISDG